MTPLLHHVLEVAVIVLGVCTVAIIVRVAQLFPHINRWKR